MWTPFVFEDVLHTSAVDKSFFDLFDRRSSSPPRVLMSFSFLRYMVADACKTTGRSIPLCTTEARKLTGPQPQ